MKNTKAFTLAELLGVITVLALIALLVFPTVSKNISHGKQSLYKSQIKNFEDAAKTWMAKHILEIPEGEINTSITLGCLKMEGLLDTAIENPVTGLPFPNDMIITIRSGANQYIYQVEEESGTKDAPLPEDICHFNSTEIKE